MVYKSREISTAASPSQTEQAENGYDVEDREIEYMPPKPQGTDRFSLEQNLNLTLTSDSSP